MQEPAIPAIGAKGARTTMDGAAADQPPRHGAPARAWVKSGADHVQACARIFAPTRDRPVKILELGGAVPGDWHVHYPQARLVLLSPHDLPETLPPDGHFNHIRGQVFDIEALAHAATLGPFDIISDAASNGGEAARVAFYFLYRSELAAGGIYVIAHDSAATSCREMVPTGDHVAAMPPDGSFIRRLADLALLRTDQSCWRDIGRLTLCPGVALVEKRSGSLRPIAPSPVFGAAAQPQRIMISVHVPKTGGTSFGLMLRQLFAEGFREDYDWTPDRPGWMVDGLEPYSDDELRTALRGIGCIHGHFSAAKYRRLQRVPGIQASFVTWVRDPVERAISTYHFLRGLETPMAQQPPWEREAKARCMRDFFEATEYSRDQQAQQLFGLELHEFAFIGITERYRASIDLFRARFWPYVPPFDIPHELRNPDRASGGYAPEQEIREILNAQNLQDRTLYDAALRRFAVRHAALCPVTSVVGSIEPMQPTVARHIGTVYEV